MNTHTQFIKSEAAQLIENIETLEAFCKVAKERATELYKQVGWNVDLVQKDKCVSAHELIRVATYCQLSAARIDLLINLDIKL